MTALGSPLIHNKFSPDTVNKLVDKAVQFSAERRLINAAVARVVFDQPLAIWRRRDTITTMINAITAAAQKYG